MILVIGGASSGKSDIAERIIRARPAPWTYIATAQAFDTEMAAKIDIHKGTRGPDWRLIEAPLDVGAALADLPPNARVLLDCATMWLSNHMLAEGDVAAQTTTLCAAISACPAHIVVVTNELGMGIVPENALARRFRVAQGALNRALAKQARSVVGVMAGLPFVLKGDLPDLAD